MFQNSSTGLGQPPLAEPSVAAFFNAILQNDTNTFFKMLEGDTNLTHASYYGRLPLHVAASKGRAEMVSQLLKHGAEINQKNDTLDTSNNQLTALEAAIWYDHLDVCKLLLEAGADPNTQSLFEGGALHYAFAYHRTEMAGWLLDHGANPFLEKKNPYNKATPVEMAITQDDGKLVPRMLDQGRKYFKASKSRSISSTGDPRGRPKPTFAEFLIAHGPTLLSAAAQRGELEAVQALIKAGVSAKGNAGNGTQLIRDFAAAEAVAIKPQDLPEDRWRQIRDLLIQHGANYDAFAATALGDLDQTRHLLSADKAVIQARDRDGQTPLHWAVRYDQLPLTSFWLQADVPPGATNVAGETALHIAAAKGLVEQSKVLLAAQAPPNIRDTNGWTPLDAAIHAQQTETIRLLLQDKAVAPRPERAVAISLHDAAAAGNLAALSALSEATNRLEARNELGLTPLQVAVQHGHLAAAALLVDKGADVNVRDPDGNTLLHRILLQGFPAAVYDRPPTNWLERMGPDPRKGTYAKYLTVEQYQPGANAALQGAGFLLACGVDARATNHAGQTALQLVAEEKTSPVLFLFDGDRTALLKLLESAGGDINAADASGETALHRAGQETTTDKAVSLIGGGADINAIDHQGRTPLHKFAEKIYGWDLNEGGTNEPFQLLVKSRANVNAQDNDGLTPLHVLALADTSFKKEATRLLLDYGAKPNLRDKQGRTPVHLFLSGKWPWSEAGDCVEMLAKAGGDLSARDGQGKTPLHYLASLGKESPMFFIRNIGNGLLTSKVDIDARDDDGNTPLLLAARNGTRDVFDWLAKQGANLDATNHAGETPRLLSARNTSPFDRPGARSAETDIFQAVRDGKVDAAERLLNTDPQLANQTNQFGQSPLQLAVTLRRTNMLHFLETHGAKWDEHSAVLAGRTEVLRTILQQRPAALTNIVMGKELIHIATEAGDVATVNLLIAAGCDLQARDYWGLSPLGRALIRKNKELQALLLGRGARENFFDAIYADDLPAVTALLAQNKSLVSLRNHNNTSALEIAAAAGSSDLLKLLLKRGARLDSDAPSDARNAVSLAAFYNQTNVLALLLRAGANINQPDQNGFTALHWAVLRGAAESAAFLLKHKADLNARIHQDMSSPLLLPGPPRLLDQDTPLHLAALCGETNMVRLLLKSGANVNAGNGMLQTPLDLATRPSMNPVGFLMRARGMSLALEPLGVSQYPPAGPFRARRSGQKTAAALIEAAGGKHSQNHASWPGWSNSPN